MTEPKRVRRTITIQTWVRYCAAPGCDIEIHGRSDRATCSDACRKKLERSRARGVDFQGCHASKG